MTFYLLKPCKGSAAYETIPKKNLKLDMDACTDKLMCGGFEVINAEVMLIVKDDLELTIYPSGKLLIKTDNKKAAERIAEKIYALLDLKKLF
jgi:hypothetical protein